MLQHRLVIAADEAHAGDGALLGGKAAHLAQLRGTGAIVPEWFAVTSEAFRTVLAAAGLDGRIAARVASLRADDQEGIRRAGAEIRGWIAATALPAELAGAITRLQVDRFGAGTFVAVRSSAIGEDARLASFAGLHDSFVFLRGPDAVLEHLKKVWASAYNERAIAYRLRQGLGLDGVSMAVVVQRMVDARVSGVMFTADPVSQSVHEIVISALYGAGEGLVSAGLEADTFVVRKATRAVTSKILTKQEQLLQDPDRGGVVKHPVPEALRDSACLTPGQIDALAAIGLAVERKFGRPQDIEFSIDGKGTIHILQSRAITTVAEYGPAAGNRLIWDNSNIIESYSGVTSPMTFSFIRRAYSIVYHCFAEVMGVPARTVRAGQGIFENMLGLFRGQVYYNLLNWYRLIGLFPGFNYNKGFMESMMGLKKPADLKDDAPSPGFVRRYFIELPALLRLVARSAWNFARIRPIVRRFEEGFRKHYSRWSALDFRSLQPHELMGLYREMEEKLLRQWKAPIINDFYVMIHYGILRKLCAKWCGDDTGSLQNDLLCGEGGIESTEPTKMLMGMARLAGQHPELARRIREDSAELLAREIPVRAEFAEFNETFRRFLDLYGFRCMNELKLEEPTLRDRPEFVYSLLRNYLTAPEATRVDARAMEAREQGIRAAAERRALKRLSLPRRSVFRPILGRARLGVKNRENMRFARTRIYGLLREVIRALGQRFADEGILEARDDVFFLTLDEVWDFIKGTAVTTDLKGLAALRRREFDGYRRVTAALPDDRFETFGMAYHRNRFRNPAERKPVDKGGDLRGTGCCPGVVTGPVKVISSPSDDVRLAGEILVAARTDPGWVPLYPSVSGLLIERGSILSHSAIVAREMGIPTIVGIAGLMEALQTGQWVAMNGSDGTIRRVDKPAP